MEIDRNKFDEVVLQGLSFLLRLSRVLGGLGFASVFAVVLLVGGIYLVATGHPTGGYALVVSSVLYGSVNGFARTSRFWFVSATPPECGRVAR